ncbi:MAG: DsbA family protein [Solirubrobacterales bacterium]
MRSRRWVPLVALGLVGAAILAAIVSISVGEKGPAAPVEGAQAVQRLYGGIEQEGNSLGSPDAPVTISIFNDVQCPECGTYQLEAVPTLIDDLVRPGDARLELRHFSLGPRGVTAGALGATAAGEQGAQWQYAQLLFGNVEEVEVSGVEDEFLDRVAAAVPGPEFDEGQWAEDLESPEVADRVTADAELAADLRLPAQPAVIVDGPGGTRQLEEAPSLDEIEAAVAEVE